MSEDKEPYEVEPETWKGIFACCLVIAVLLAGAFALSVIMPLVFNGQLALMPLHQIVGG